MKKKLKIFTRAKIFLSVFLCVLLLGSNFVFADSAQFFYVNQIDSLSAANVYTDGSIIGSVTGYGDIHVGSNLSNVYIGYVINGSYNDFYFIVPNSVNSSANNFFLAYSNVGGSNPTTNASTGSGYKAYRSRLTGTYTGDLFAFSTVSDMLSAFSTWTPPVPTPTVSGNFDLQVGNITFIDLGSSGASYDLTLKSYFNKLSGTLSGGWEYDNRRYGFSSSLPDTTFSVDGTSGSGFLWTKTDPKNLLGRSHYGLSNISGTSSGRYLWIVNPLYNENYFNDSLSGDSLNGRINISGLPVGCTFYTYPLVQSATSISLASDVATISGGTGTVSDTGGNTPTVSIDDPNSSYTQPIGGDNSPPQEVTLQEGVNQLFQTLKDFTEKVINLISTPADFIQQLISAGQGFTQAIASMFTWLPESVQDVLIAALGVMIVVGFLKLLF